MSESIVNMKVKAQETLCDDDGAWGEDVTEPMRAVIDSCKETVKEAYDRFTTDLTHDQKRMFDELLNGYKGKVTYQCTDTQSPESLRDQMGCRISYVENPNKTLTVQGQENINFLGAMQLFRDMSLKIKTVETKDKEPIPFTREELAARLALKKDESLPAELETICTDGAIPYVVANKIPKLYKDGLALVGNDETKKAALSQAIDAWAKLKAGEISATSPESWQAAVLNGEVSTAGIGPGEGGALTITSSADKTTFPVLTKWKKGYHDSFMAPVIAGIIAQTKKVADDKKLDLKDKTNIGKITDSIILQLHFKLPEEAASTFVSGIAADGTVTLNEKTAGEFRTNPDLGRFGSIAVREKMSAITVDAIIAAKASADEAKIDDLRTQVIALAKEMLNKPGGAKEFLNSRFDGLDADGRVKKFAAEEAASGSVLPKGLEVKADGALFRQGGVTAPYFLTSIEYDHEFADEGEKGARFTLGASASYANIQIVDVRRAPEDELLYKAPSQGADYSGVGDASIRPGIKIGEDKTVSHSGQVNLGLMSNDNPVSGGILGIRPSYTVTWGDGSAKERMGGTASAQFGYGEVMEKVSSAVSLGVEPDVGGLDPVINDQTEGGGRAKEVLLSSSWRPVQTDNEGVNFGLKLGVDAMYRWRDEGEDRPNEAFFGPKVSAELDLSKDDKLSYKPFLRLARDYTEVQYAALVWDHNFSDYWKMSPYVFFRGKYLPEYAKEGDTSEEAVAAASYENFGSGSGPRPPELPPGVLTPLNERGQEPVHTAGLGALFCFGDKVKFCGGPEYRRVTTTDRGENYYGLRIGINNKPQ